MDLEGWSDVEIRRPEPAMQETLPASCGHVGPFNWHQQRRGEEKRPEANAEPVRARGVE